MVRLLARWLWFSLVLWGGWVVAALVMLVAGLDSRIAQQNGVCSGWAAFICWLPGLVLLGWPEGRHPFARVGLVVIGTLTRLGLVLAFLLLVQRQRWVEDFVMLGCWVAGYYLLALAAETYLLVNLREEQPRDGAG